MNLVTKEKKQSTKIEDAPEKEKKSEEEIDPENAEEGPSRMSGE